MTLAEGTLADPDFEQRLWDLYGQQDQAREATYQRVSAGQVRRAAQIVSEHPHMTPGAVISLTFTDAPEDLVDALAVEEAGALTDDPLWKRLWFDHAFPAVKAGVRGAITGIYSKWYEDVDRPVRSLAKASDVASSGEGFFDVGEFFGAVQPAYEALGPSPGVRALAQATEQRSYSGINLGQGWFPGGDIAPPGTPQRQLGTPLGHAHQQQLADVRFSSTDQPVSMGSIGASSVWLLADQIGQGEVTEPGTRAYDFSEMVFGIAWEMLTDPTLALDRPIRAALAARKTFGGATAGTELAENIRLFGMVDGPRRTVLPEVDMDNWLQSRQGQAAREYLTQESDFENVRRLLAGNAEAAHAIVNTADPDDVDSILKHFAGRGVDQRFSAPLTHRIGKRLEDTRLARYWEAGTDLLDDPDATLTRAGSWTPGDGIPLDRNMVSNAAEQYNRWFRNWQAPKAMASKYEERMVGAILEGDRHKAWGVWEDGLDELGSYLTDIGHDKGTVRSLTRMMGGPDFGTGTNQRIYWMEPLTEAPETIRPGTRVETLADGTEWLAHMRPHDAVELMDEAIPFMNVDAIKRATSTLSRVVKAPGVVDDDATFWRKLAGDVGEVFGGLGIDDAPKGVVWSVHDAMWSIQRSVWMPLALVTRVAWPMRVVGEEQLRMGAVGLDSMFHHPISYWAWAIANPKTKVGKFLQQDFASLGIRPRGAVDVLGNPIDQAAEFSGAMVGHQRPRAYHGSRPRPGAVGWDRLDAHQAMSQGQTSRVTAAYHIEMGKMWKSPVFQRVADSILKGDNSLDDVFDWFHGSQLHEGMMATSDDFAQQLATPQGVRNWLASEAKRVRQMTGGDPELLQSIVDRSLRGNNVYDVRVNKSAINRTLSEKVRQLHDTGDLPRWMVVPQDIAQGVDPSKWSRATAWMFYGLGAVPSNKLSRSVAFRQMYWNDMLDRIGHADNATQEAIWRAGREANMDKDWLRRAANRMKESRAGRPVDAEHVVQSLDEADMLAKHNALRGANSLLYSLTEKGQVADAMRLIFPFAEAWKEVGLTWAKILGRTPLHLRRAQIFVEGARDSGFFYKDPTTGEESFTAPGGGLFEAFADLPGNVRANLPSTLASLNMFTAGVLPGLGPWAQAGTGLLLPDDPTSDVRDMLLPYGSEAEELVDLVNPLTYIETIAPSWMRKMVVGLTEEGYDQRMWRSHEVDVTRALLASGDFDTSTDAGRRKLEEAVDSLTRKTILFRALGQAVLPAGFRVDFQVQPDSPDAEAEMRKVLGPNPELGRHDGNFFSMAVLASLFHTLKDQADGNTYEAVRTFTEMFGSDPDDYDMAKWVASLGQSKTVSLEQRARTNTGRAWEQAHPELVESIPEVVGYFAPDGDEEDRLDIGAYLGDIEAGGRVPLDGEQFVLMSHKLLGSAIYRHAQEQADQLPTAEARKHKALRRDWLDANLPYWRWDHPVPGVPETPTLEQRIQALEEAVSHQAVVDTPAGQGLVDYLTRREQAIARIMGSADVTTREDALNALKRDEMRPLRSWLRQHARDITLEHGEFAPIWRNILRHELGEES